MNSEGKGALLEELHGLELRIADILRVVGELIQERDKANTNETKKMVIQNCKKFSESIQELQKDIHIFIDRMPRCDYARLDTTLLDRYKEAISKLMD